MSEILWHAGCWLVLGLACLYACSEPGPAMPAPSVRDILFPQADTRKKP